MSEDDFEAEAKRRGFVKNKGDSSEATSKGGCLGDCFGRRESKPFETMHEEVDDNFEFRPRTQLQSNERRNRETATSNTPDHITLPSDTPPQTTQTTPMDTPPMTPRQQ